jgi:hypothetical protein
MQRDLGVVQAERLDRTFEHHLATLDREATGGDGVGDVACRDRAVELASVAGRADRGEDLAFELGGDRLGFFLEFERWVSKCAMFSFVARRALFCGSRKLRA